MALIKCPECGKEISDKAPQCIHCGYPIAQETIPATTSSSTADKKYKILLIHAGAKANTAKIISDLTNISSEEATQLTETCPRYIVSNVSLDEFLIIKGYFNEVNATVECKEMTGDEFLSIPPLSPSFFKQWKSCPTCGKDVSKNAYTCPFCGYTFAQLTDEKKGGLGFWKIVGAVIVAILILSFF